MTYWWRVEVRDGAGLLVAIEPEMLAGWSELTDEQEKIIENAAIHLGGPPNELITGDNQ
jgi:hypothetical protein